MLKELDQRKKIVNKNKTLWIRKFVNANFNDDSGKLNKLPEINDDFEGCKCFRITEKQEGELKFYSCFYKSP